jgi:hypothetical protein
VTAASDARTADDPRMADLAGLGPPMLPKSIIGEAVTYSTNR